MAACDASCEEDEAMHQRREEHDLLAAQRGRTAMLQEQRKREREAEQRLLKKKRKRQKNASVQADFLTQKSASRSPIKILVPANVVEEEECCEEEEINAPRVETFASKPNLHKNSTSNYNPKNFASDSVDSSNNYESVDEISSSELELDSEEEFHQITNLLKQKCYEQYRDPPVTLSEEPMIISDSSSIEADPLPPPKTKKKTLVALQPAKRSILKKCQTKPVKTKTPEPSSIKQSAERDNRVKYVDFANQYTTSYAPDVDLVTQNTETSKTNAKTAAKKHRTPVVNDDILR